jgi:aryl-alcohol dehydrogenase-like predicted oxidoreductase
LIRLRQTTSQTNSHFPPSGGKSLDLCFLHGPDPVTPLDETVRAYDDLVRQGEVRCVGVANLFGWQIATVTSVACWRFKTSRLR